MLLLFKDNDGTVNVVADGIIIYTPRISESENMTRFASFIIKFGSLKTSDGTWKPKLIKCITFNPLLIDIVEMIDRNDSVFLTGVRIIDKEYTNKSDETKYCISCSTIVPIKQMYKMLCWNKQSMEYEKKIYKDVIKKQEHGVITYDGGLDEKEDFNF